MVALVQSKQGPRSSPTHCVACVVENQSGADQAFQSGLCKAAFHSLKVRRDRPIILSAQDLETMNCFSFALTTLSPGSLYYNVTCLGPARTTMGSRDLISIQILPRNESLQNVHFIPLISHKNIPHA